jgi:hypothetical protein
MGGPCAGQAAGLLKFSLAGDQGLEVIAVGCPDRKPVVSDPVRPAGPLEATKPTGRSGLRCDPEMFAVHLNRLAKAYGSVRHTRFGSFPYTADILVERKNHGHAVLLVLRQLGASLLHRLDRETGWATTGASKSMLFDLAAKDIREGGLRLHDETSYWQLTAIDGATLAAPPGQHDDRAIACVLALAALRSSGPGLVSVPAIPPVDVIKLADKGRW